ncbi:MAG: MlaD family protein [Candidatus Aminicenantaceae bacterium]
MSREANPKIVGAFVLGALALIVVVFVIFGSGRFFQPLNAWVMFFQGNVKGLKIGSPVLVRGVEIGAVSFIQALMDQEGELLVEVIIKTRPNTVEDMSDLLIDLPDKEAADFLIEHGLRAQLNSVSLVTGMLYIKLDFFPETPVRLVDLNDDHLEIPTIPTPGELLQDRLLASLEKFEKMPLLEITEELHQAVIVFRESLGEITKIAQVVNDIDIQTTLTQLNQSLEAVEGLMANLDSQVDPIASEFAATAQAAQDTLRSIEKVMKDLENSAAEERYELRTLLMELSKANRAVRVLVDYLQRNPKSLVWGKK